MKTLITYRFSQIFNYDPILRQVIETRSVKRDIKDSTNNTLTKTQILRARSKRYDILDVPKSISEAIKNGDAISFNVDITKEQTELLMQKTFDLFSFDVDNNTSNKVRYVL
jgi:hypothetical protein